MTERKRSEVREMQRVRETVGERTIEREELEKKDEERSRKKQTKVGRERTEKAYPRSCVYLTIIPIRNNLWIYACNSCTVRETERVRRKRRAKREWTEKELLRKRENERNSERGERGRKRKLVCK